MGIDVYFCAEQNGEIEQVGEGERVANVDGFLVLAYMFGIVLEPIREMAENIPEGLDVDPETYREGIARFERYLAQNRDQGRLRFAGYYDFLKKNAEWMRAQEMNNVFGPPVVEQLPLEAIDEDSQAFFGWFMLSERIISPEEAEQLAPILGAARGMFTAFATHYEKENPNLAHMMSDAYGMLGTATEFCDKAASEGKPFYFSA